MLQKVNEAMLSGEKYTKLKYSDIMEINSLKINHIIHSYHRLYLFGLIHIIDLFNNNKRTFLNKKSLKK